MQRSKVGIPLPRGTLLNTATVAVGALFGWAIGEHIPVAYRAVAMSGLGLIVLGIGAKMFLEAKHIVIVAGAIVFGGMVGLLLGFQSGIDSFADWARHALHAQGGSSFNEALVTTSVLFCVGPMTILGCMEDGLQGKIDLLAIKSTMDGIGAIFFAAAAGPGALGVLVTAGVVLVVQSALTLTARMLQPVARDPELLSEITGAGGVMMMAIGLGLLEIKRLSVVTYLPALIFAPLAVAAMRRFKGAKISVARQPSFTASYKDKREAVSDE